MAATFWVGGHWTDDAPKLTGPADHAFWQSSVVFDGARAFGGLAPDLDLHCRRAIASCHALGLTPTLEAAEIERLAIEGIKRFPAEAVLYIKPVFYQAGGLITSDSGHTEFVLHLMEAPFPGPGGFSATVSPLRRPAPDMATTDAKASSLYPNSDRATREAVGRGFEAAVMRDPWDNIAEFAFANLMMARDGQVLTPVANGTFLAGITRRRVMGLLNEAVLEAVAGDHLAVIADAENQGGGVDHRGSGRGRRDFQRRQLRQGGHLQPLRGPPAERRSNRARGQAALFCMGGGLPGRLTPFGGLGRPPGGFHLGQCGLRRQAPLGGQARLDGREPAAELVVGMADAGFGIEFQLARQVGEHEQHVAELVLQAALVPARQLGAQFADFLVELVEHRRSVRPIEADPGRARRQLGGAGQAGEGSGHSGQHAGLRAGGPFGAFLLLPLGRLAFGIKGSRGAEHMRVAPHHLVGNQARNVGKAEQAGLFGHAGMEHHLEQQVAQFGGQGREVAARDGVGDLIGLLDRIGRDGLEALRLIPRTAGTRRAQSAHDVEQAAQLAFGIVQGSSVGHRRVLPRPTVQVNGACWSVIVADRVGNVRFECRAAFRA
jgi:branched-chain amino acid aminotransferase